MLLWRMVVLIAALPLLALAGCGATAPKQATGLTISSTPPEPGDPVQGRELFVNTLALTGSPNCSSCHVVESGAEAVVGPSLAGIASVAGSRVGNQSAAQYLWISMVAPNEYIVEGYAAGIMPRTYALYMSEEQLADLLAYMLTLEE